MKTWGFFRGGGRLPTEAEIDEVRARVGYAHVVLDPRDGPIRFDRPGIELDLGGIAKGYAVDRVVALLRREQAWPRPWSARGEHDLRPGRAPRPRRVGRRRPGSGRHRPRRPHRAPQGPRPLRVRQLREVVRAGRRARTRTSWTRAGAAGAGRAERGRARAHRHGGRRAGQRVLRAGGGGQPAASAAAAGDRSVFFLPRAGNRWKMVRLRRTS